MPAQPNCLESNSLPMLPKIKGQEARQSQIASCSATRSSTVVLPQPGGPVRSRFLNGVIDCPLIMVHQSGRSTRRSQSCHHDQA